VSAPTGASPEGIPEDLATGFWMWVIALPLMLTGYVVGGVTTTGPTPAWLVHASAAMFVVIVGPIVLTFLILMRRGYRWARSVLMGGGAASVVYVISHLFGIQLPPVAAVVYAATTIVGAVLIIGGAVLVHRKDAHAYLVR
jgi:hypothetical protein